MGNRKFKGLKRVFARFSGSAEEQINICFNSDTGKVFEY